MTVPTNIYRFPVTAAVELHAIHDGPHTHCPQCGAYAQRCNLCEATRTDRWFGEPCHFFCNGKFYPLVNKDTPFELTYLHDPRRVCAPTRRMRFGFLWLRRCAEPGTHVHQMCQRCGWRGIGTVHP